jgi:hypothetical protein
MNTYRISLKETGDIIACDKRSMSIRDGYVQLSGPKIGEHQHLSMIVPFTSILYIEEIMDTDVNSGVKPESNVKMWRFGTEPPKD